MFKEDEKENIITVLDQKFKKIWIVPNNQDIKSITMEEKLYANNLLPHRAKEYSFARGYARFLLGRIFKMMPLEIPMYAPPGAPPELSSNYGYLNISHCQNALLVGWSNQPIGVDIELSKRVFAAEKLYKKFYSQKDKKDLSKLFGDNLRSAVLDHWTIKEAAIKLKRSNLIKELNKWEWYKENSQVIHRTKGYKVKILKLDTLDWKIAAAY